MLKRILKLGKQKLWTKYRDEVIKKHDLLYLFWECTMNCNFLCKHCGSSAGEKRCEGELTTDDIQKAFSEIASDFDPKHITIAITGGEPFLRHDLFEVMAYARNLWFQWGMVTNGFFINENVVAKMQEAGMASIDVSIDGLSETHDYLRGMPWAYARGVRAVKLLHDANFLKSLRITTTINKKNIHQLEAMYETFSALGITVWRVLTIEPLWRAENNADLLLDRDEQVQVLQFIKQKRKISRIDIIYGCNTYLWIEFEEEVRPNFFFCSAGINVASILYNGDIFVCPSVPRNSKLIWWNIKADRFSEVWNNKFSWYRETHRTANEKCVNCEHWENCRGGNLHSWGFEEGWQKSCFLR